MFVCYASLKPIYSPPPLTFFRLIGNELDVAFGGFLNELFSLANLMIDVAREVTGGKVQLITMPLSETSFLKIVKKYYAVIQIDFWSLQTYDRYTKTPEDYVNATYDKRNPDVLLKPIVVTEFGSSSIQVCIPSPQVPTLLLHTRLITQYFTLHNKVSLLLTT